MPISKFSPVSHDVLQSRLRQHMPVLDGLRGLSIIFVVWHNMLNTSNWHAASWVDRVLHTVGNIGWLGVQLFFVLSGFLITGILLEKRGTAHVFRDFYARRALRIFPLYYLTLAVLLIVFPVLGIHAGGGSEPVAVAHNSASIHTFWYWLYLSNWSIPIVGGPGALSHTWSLSVEEQFYLFWPFAVIFLERRRLSVLCVALIVTAPLARCLMLQKGFDFAEWRAYEFTCARWDGLAFGALFAIMLRDHRATLRLPLIIRPLLWLCGAYFVVVLIATHGYSAVETPGTVLNQSVAALFFAGVIYVLLAAGDVSRLRSAHIVGSKALRACGKYSYAIYIFHYPVIVYIGTGFQQLLIKGWSLPINIAVVATGLFVFAASFLLAVCSWNLLEQPCLRLKRYFSHGRPESSPLQVMPPEYESR